MRTRTAIVITGPTASGKSALAVSLARRLDSEIISADSRQIYRGMPIATAQPDEEQLREVRHHLVGTLQPDAYYSAAEFESDALRISEELMERGCVPVVCGGSMMYVDAYCGAIDEVPTVSGEVRARLKRLHALLGDRWLLDTLARLDPAHRAKVDPKNWKRVFHAVEVCRQTGAPYSSLMTGQRKRRDFRILKFALDLPREVLFDRINRRTDRMVEAGLVEEIRKMLPYRDCNSMNTVGVKEILRYLDGEWSLEQAVDRMKKNTRVYAKKQLTWLRRDPDIIWVKPGEAEKRILENFEI